MERLHFLIRDSILKVVDFFYPLFKRFMPLQTFRYAACGGSNTLLSIFIYFITYNFILQKKILHLGFISISPHIAALIIATGFTLPIGFYLSMYVVFQGSYLRRRVQFFRYFLVAMFCLLLNYVLLKTFVEVLGWYPTVSQIINTAIVVTFSYLSQKHFSFKSKKIKISLEQPVHPH
jgi:putative flippase GtrA